MMVNQGHLVLTHSHFNGMTLRPSDAVGGAWYRATGTPRLAVGWEGATDPACKGGS